MRALSCQSGWWSWPVEPLTCVYWTRPAPQYPGKTPRLPPFFLFLSFFLFHFVFVFLPFLLSVFLALPSHNITFYLLLSFIFETHRCLSSLFFSPLSRTVYFLWLSLPCSSFSAILLFPLSLFSRCPFLFCIILGPLCQSFRVLKPRRLSLVAVFISSLHLAEHTRGHARTATRRLIETCVSKLLMFTEALYCR